jgi:glycine/D-amino acid oxidase-like deaminating enzyme
MMGPRPLPDPDEVGQTKLADGLIVAAGHGPEGLTAGPWSGLAVALLALGEPPVTDLAPFDPSRLHA